MRIADELYYGCIHPYETVSETKEHKEACSIKDRIMKQLEEELPEKLKETLDRLGDSILEMECENGRLMFRLGLSLGLRLAAESFLCENHQI